MTTPVKRPSGADARTIFGGLRHKELEVIRARHGLSKDPPILTGIALSGGGIRSAAFNLGVLQALGKRGILGAMHYMSTVSGGGYIGSCYSAMTAGNPGGGFPFAFDGRDEPPIVRHLRRHSSYLAPRRGVFSLDSWRLVSAYAGGLLVTATTVLGWLMLIAATAIWFHGWLMTLTARWVPLPDGRAEFFYPGAAALLLWAAAGVFHLPHIVRVREYSFTFRQGLARLQARLFAAAVVLAVLGALPIVFVMLDVQFRVRLAGGASILIVLLAPLLKVAGTLRASAGLLRRIGLMAGLTLLALLICLLVLFAAWAFQDNLRLLMLGSAAVLVVLGLTADINRISLFYTYRDKLSEAFVVRGESTGMISQERLRLSQLAGHDLRMPFHLINTTLNLAGSSDPKLHGRKGDFFLLSPLHCGSLVTDYRPTTEYERDGVSLASALAVSGAAASPQMGYATRPALAFLMTLFNVRLGVWAENPMFTGRLRPRWFWPYYLLAELFSLANEQRDLVYLSDGGHMENLGVMELLRRECDVIICSDASADPQREFADLGRLIRLARIDLGVQIELDAEPLRPDPALGLSAAHVVLGRIAYSGTAKVGLLVYVKTAVCAGDSLDLRSYQRRHPDFPHQSTSDQFFDEAQFESYRELGYISGRAVHDALTDVRAQRRAPPRDVQGQLVVPLLDPAARRLAAP